MIYSTYLIFCLAEDGFKWATFVINFASIKIWFMASLPLAWVPKCRKYNYQQLLNLRLLLFVFTLVYFQYFIRWFRNLYIDLCTSKPPNNTEWCVQLFSNSYTYIYICHDSKNILSTEKMFVSAGSLVRIRCY